MLDLQVASIKSRDIVLLLTVAYVSMEGFEKQGVSLFKTSAGKLITIEVTVNSHVA